MSSYEEIREGLRVLFASQSIMIGKVESIDKEKVLCTVSLVANPEIVLQEVRLRAVDDEQDKGMVLFPAVGSAVLVGKIDNISAYYIAMFSEVESIEIQCEKTIFNKGELGGMVKLKPLTAKIKKLETELNTLKNLLTTWVPVPSDGGAALKIALAPFTSQPITVTQESELENPKIKQ
jgi:hypothetical protein